MKKLNNCHLFITLVQREGKKKINDLLHEELLLNLLYIIHNHVRVIVSYRLWGEKRFTY